jgi:hypothetical protein
MRSGLSFQLSGKYQQTAARVLIHVDTALGHDVSHSSAHAPEMKPEQRQEQAVTPQQEQSLDIDLGF